MPKAADKLKTALRPRANSKSWPDVLLLLLSGVWLVAPLFYVLFGNSPSASDVCAGPGFADFGCTGGWDAVVANVIGVLAMLFVLSLFLLALLRLMSRRKGNSHG